MNIIIYIILQTLIISKAHALSIYQHSPLSQNNNIFVNFKHGNKARIRVPSLSSQSLLLSPSKSSSTALGYDLFGTGTILTAYESLELDGK